VVVSSAVAFVPRGEPPDVAAARPDGAAAITAALEALAVPEGGAGS
jgi:hypothetical protein